jgi:hypothetical protein
MSLLISEKQLGVAWPEILAEVETIGFPNRVIRASQKGSCTIRIAKVLSEAIILEAMLMGLLYIIVIGFFASAM